MEKNILSKGKIFIKVIVQVALFQEEGIWVAYCPALELSSYGDDPGDAREAFEEAMKIFLDETERKGTMERYLLKLGWQLQQKPKPVYNQPKLSLLDNKRILSKNPEIFTEKVSIPVA
jgi:hypothetical protein